MELKAVAVRGARCVSALLKSGWTTSVVKPKTNISVSKEVFGQRPKNVQLAALLSPRVVILPFLAILAVAARRCEVGATNGPMAREEEKN